MREEKSEHKTKNNIIVITDMAITIETFLLKFDKFDRIRIEFIDKYEDRAERLIRLIKRVAMEEQDRGVSIKTVTDKKTIPPTTYTIKSNFIILEKTGYMKLWP